MIHFGFSYVGLLYLIMLFVPNGIWAKNKPSDYEKYEKNESKILLAFERAGEVLLCICALIFSDNNVRPHSLWIGWLILSFLMMVFYELYWIRYFRSSKTMADMYSSFLIFPVAGASLPVLAFFFLGIYASNIITIVSALIMGIGHIGIHLAHRREVVSKKKWPKWRIIVNVIIFLFLLPSFVLTTAFIGVIAVRNYNGVICAADLAGGIDEAIYVDINGQKQFITIRGKNEENPVILYLHGGPGSPDSSVAYKFSEGLLDDYTFVCWDQRGCGRTYLNNDDPQNLTVSFAQALSDVDALVDYLSNRFGRDKVTIIGHSYGSLLGSKYAYDNPSKVAAYIGLGQYVNDKASVTYDYEWSLAKAKEAGDDTSELEEAYKAYLEDVSIITSTRVSNCTDKYHEETGSYDTLIAALFSPYFESDDLKWYFSMMDLDDFIAMSSDLVPYLLEVDLRESQASYEVPVLMISGDNDWNCSFKVMTDYAEQTGSEYKLFEGCGHYVQFDDPERFAQEVKSFLSNVIGV